MVQKSLILLGKKPVKLIFKKVFVKISIKPIKIKNFQYLQM